MTTVLQVLYLSMLIILSLCIRKRHECFIQSILWLMLLGILTKCLAFRFIQDISQERQKDYTYDVFDSLEYSEALSTLITLIFVVKYDLSTRLLPLVVQDLSLDLQLAVQRE